MRTIDDADKLLLIQRRLTVALLGVGLLYILFQVSNYFGDLLRILGISFLLSYLFIGAVDFLQKYIRNRALCVGLVYIVVLSATIITAVFLIPAMVYQVASLVSTTVNEIPSWLKNLETSLAPIQERFNQIHMDIKVFDLITNFIAQAPKPDPAAIVARVTDMAMSTMTWSMYSVSISVVSFYFLLDGHRMNTTFIAFFPETMRPAMRSLITAIDTSLQSFFKGQVVLGVLFGVVMLAVYWALGVQYSLLLSAFLAICEILPVIGPPIGFAPAVVAVAIHGTVLPGARIVHILVLTGIFMILQQVKDSVVGPRYIGNVIGLHPVAIFMAIMIGARIDGMLGIILSIPAACVVNVLISHMPSLLAHNGTYKTKGDEDANDEIPAMLPVITGVESTET
jgi:predicted PurR-regulated permease PerM